MAILIFGYEVVFANSLGPVCTSKGVIIPCAKTAWEFGMQALYLNPNYGVGYLTTLNNVTDNALDIFAAAQTTIQTNNTVNSNWGWGFRLEGAYHFRGGNDLNLNWYHYNQTVNQSLAQGPSPLNYINSYLTFSDFYSDVDTSLKTQWDAVNLEFGQQLDSIEWIKFRFHGGFQYAYLRSNFNERASSASTASSTGFLFNDTSSASDELKYSGLGPRIGADLSYPLNGRLFVYTKAACAILVGTQGIRTSVYTLSNILDPILPIGTPGATLLSSTSWQTVAAMDAKAGVTYSYLMTHSQLNLDTGWIWSMYINPFVSIGNFGIQGPYVGLKWVG